MLKVDGLELAKKGVIFLEMNIPNTVTLPIISLAIHKRKKTFLEMILRLIMMRKIVELEHP